MSLIKNLYDCVDSQIMNHVNAGVRAWNWTTGRTKSELASTLAWATPALTATAGIYYEDPVLLMHPAFYSVIAYISSNIWGIQEKIERYADEKKMIDPIAEEVKRSSEKMGLIHGIFGVLSAPSLFFSLGNFSFSGGCYVSRADSLPPRKDCIRRGLDKLVEFYQTRKQEEALPNPA